MFLGYPIQIWIAIIIATIVKITSNKRLTLIGSIVSILISLSLSLILYGPIVEILGISNAWEVPIAILIALTIENMLKAVLELSNDKDVLKDWISLLIKGRHRE